MTPGLSTMTPAQQKRLTALMMRDFQNGIADGCAIPAASAESIDKLLDNIERSQRRREELLERQNRDALDEIFTREELFRFAYVPFVIAELVWDYADTVILLARRLNDPSARRLSRAIRQARTDYDRLRRRHIDAAHRANEVENGYLFEEATSRITAQMALNLRLDIDREYPDLGEDSRNLLQAVYQCHITSRALLRYLDRQSQRVAERVGHSIGKMLPHSYYVMDRLIPEFVGDKPASPRFRELMSRYVDTFANQIALVELNDIDTDQTDQSL